ncbi:hypothetical protein Tco_0343479 [Tanacetum coccineum]
MIRAQDQRPDNMKEQAYNKDKDQERLKNSTTKQSQETQDRKHRSLESVGNLASGEIVSLKILSQNGSSVSRHVASDDLRDALSVIFGLSELKEIIVMSADSAVTYTSVHSEARSWSIPSEDPYEEAARQLLEQAPRSPEYVPDPMELEDHVPVYIPEPEHPEDLVPAEDEAPTPLLPPFFLSPRIRPLSPRALEVEMRDIASAFYHSLYLSGTPPLLPIPLPAPSTSHRADIPEANTPPQKRLLLTTPRPGCEVGESSAATALRQPGPTIETRL